MFNKNKPLSDNPCRFVNETSRVLETIVVTVEKNVCVYIIDLVESMTAVNDGC